MECFLDIEDFLKTKTIKTRLAEEELEVIAAKEYPIAIPVVANNAKSSGNA